MRILGVDPGTYRTGTGIIEAEGSRYKMIHSQTIEFKAGTPLSVRLSEIFQRLGAMIQAYRPQILALENIFYGRDLRAMVKIGEARACAMLAASQQGIEVVEYAPARVKQAVTGNGRAAKEQVQYMVQKMLNLKDALPADSSDALALAICHLHSYKHLQGMERVRVSLGNTH